MVKRIWDLDDPAATLRHIQRLCPFRHGRSVVAAIRLSDQAVTDARVATDGGKGLPSPPDDSDLACQLAHEIVPERYSITGDNGGMSHVLVTVVCRDGYVLAGRPEYDWLRAWRYSNHMRGAFSGDVYMVTPHGWTGAIDQRAGVDPYVGRDSAHRLTVVR